MASRKLLSIVTPCYNEEGSVRECYERVRRIMEEQLPDLDYEHIFADNCSLDSTAEILRDIAGQDSRVKVILNSRNFGAPRSMFNAQRAAYGDAVIAYLPADLQDPPELIPEMVRLWQSGYEVVYGRRAQREENGLLFAMRRIFYQTVNRFASYQVPPNAGDFQLLDRKVMDALRQCDDYFPYVRGMIAGCGFRTVGLDYQMVRRKEGKSKANWYVLIDQAINAIISVSQVPLRFALLAGFALSALSILYSIITFVTVLLRGSDAEHGVPTVAVGLFFFAGVQLFFLGLLGEYVGAVHAIVRRRPMVIERERINFDPPAEAPAAQRQTQREPAQP